jgi:hypothetical protein
LVTSWMGNFATRSDLIKYSSLQTMHLLVRKPKMHASTSVVSLTRGPRVLRVMDVYDDSLEIGNPGVRLCVCRLGA